MANTDNAETKNNKVPLSMKLDPDIFAVVSRLAVEDDRSLSNMVERLLKTNPQVQEILGADTAAAGAGN